MIFEEQGDDGVSTVIGAILLVAMTVVMATILGQFAFGFAGDLQKPPQGNVLFKSSINDASPSSDSYNITAVATSMRNADQLTVRPSTGPGMEFQETGESQKETYDEGTTLTVIAQKGDRTQVVQVYSVGKAP